MSDQFQNINFYTTGEVARLCGVTVRTVQYYDTRGVLTPSELSEGGRRLYSEEDLRRMRVICFLREIGIPLTGISKLLSEDRPEEVISILLEQQERELRSEITERRERLQKLENLRGELKSIDHFSVEAIGDIANVMKNNKKLFRMRSVMITVGVIAEVIEIATVVLWAATGIWWPFALGLPVAIALCIWLSVYYYRCVAYICPSCHKVFKPTFGAMFWAAHTPKTRRLTCPECGHKGFCVETSEEELGEVYD